MDNRIKDILASKGMTSLELANSIGISRVSLSNIINNKQEASANTLKLISEKLNVHFWELFVSMDTIKEEISEKDSNTIICPKCGARFKME